jgi:RND family efflux transporter MFP subunit
MQIKNQLFNHNLFKNKYVLPFIVLTIFILLAKLVTSNPPTSKRGKLSSAAQLNVDVETIKKQRFSLTINSYGTVKPRTQSILLPQVSGQIIQISENFRAGGFFEKGEVLIELDDRDLKAEVQIAQANLFSAEQLLSEEQARVAQAKQDWKRLGQGETAPDLVLRKPQLLAAQAKVYSAQATLSKAKLALERTKITAPFTGRVLTKDVDIGQVISLNTQLAEIYAIDYVEIRLPIKNKDLSYMILPEAGRFKKVSQSQQPQVTIYSDLTARQSWLGKVVRTEGAFDSNSQQLFVVAQIDDPYGRINTSALPLKIGQYVSATIKGKDVEDSIIIDNKAIYQGSYVYILQNKKLQRVDVDIAWQNETVAMIKQGLNAGQLLVTTPLGQVNSGTPVAINSKDRKVIAKKHRQKKLLKKTKEEPENQQVRAAANQGEEQ